MLFRGSRLRKICKEVGEITATTKRIAEEIVEIVEKHQGAGLAASQIGYDVRMFVVCVGEEADEKGNPIGIEPIIYINPKITKFYSEKCTMKEGCLSIPGILEDLERPCAVDVEALDLEGKTFIETNVKGWKSRCIQHEMDHINGILFIDHLSDEVREALQADLDLIEQKYYKLAPMHKGNNLSDL